VAFHIIADEREYQYRGTIDATRESDTVLIGSLSLVRGSTATPLDPSDIFFHDILKFIRHENATFRGIALELIVRSIDGREPDSRIFDFT
jgi:hypothetical protein